MDRMKTYDEILTNLEGIPFDILDISGIKKPVTRPVGDVRSATLPSLLLDARLSKETLQKEIERVDRMERKRKALRERKKYTRKRGTVHPKKKEASRRRLMDRRWATNPLGCLLHSYGKKDIDKDLWYEHIAPLWEKYNPRDLEIKKYRGWGTKQRPLTVFGMDVVHKTEGVVYDGNALELYLLSNKKAP